MPTQTAKASESSPGYILIHERGRVVMSFYVWSVVAVYEATKPDKFGSTVVSFQRPDSDNGFWLSTFASVAEVQSAIDDAIAAWKKTRPPRIKVADLKKAVAAAAR